MKFRDWEGQIFVFFLYFGVGKGSTEPHQVLIFGVLASLATFPGLKCFLFPNFEFSKNDKKKFKAFLNFFFRTYPTQNVLWTFFEQNIFSVNL